MIIVGLVGYAGAGKTTIAQEIARQHGDAECVAFADCLKTRAAHALGITREDLDKNKWALRPFLVEFGRAGRMLKPNVWIERLEPVLTCFRLFGKPTMAIVHDARYLNECEHICRSGGHVFYIQRPGVGAANDEEFTSIGELMATMDLPIIENNSTPADAARDILARLGVSEFNEGKVKA